MNFIQLNYHEFINLDYVVKIEKGGCLHLTFYNGDTMVITDDKIIKEILDKIR